MKIYRHQLQHACVLSDGLFELRSSLVGGECYRCNGAAVVVNRNREPVSNSESRGFLKQFLRFGGYQEADSNTPFKRLRMAECLNDNRIEALVMSLQIMGCPS